jgi:hypothetical protein
MVTEKKKTAIRTLLRVDTNGAATCLRLNPEYALGHNNLGTLPMSKAYSRGGLIWTRLWYIQIF